MDYRGLLEKAIEAEKRSVRKRITQAALFACDHGMETD